MSSVARQQPSIPRPWNGLFSPIARELEAVEEILHRELVSKYPFVAQLVQHALGMGGKRLRPTLLLLSALACGSLHSEHLVLAAVMEMIHTATLVHDDVLDEATLRRHVDTINARWNNESSVLLGDYLFTHAFYLASTLDTTYACRMVGKTTNVVCEGELRQVHSRGDFGLSEATYLEIIEAKTAALCECCCRLGAHYAGADESLEESLGQYGRSLGMAFQIVDDLLDLDGDEPTTGKSLGSDLTKQKLTLPLIRLLDQLPLSKRDQVIALVRLPDNERRTALEPWLRDSDAMEYSREKALAFARDARAQLRGLQPGTALDLLRTMTELVVDRRR